jgi:hypothetical protein
MFTKKILISVLLAAATIGAIATPLPSLAAVGVYLNFGPPPPPVEIIPPPRYGYVWVPGYWNWRGHRHVWVQGVWIRERPGHVYQPHRWVERGGRWYFERGHWDRPGRRDRDGVPDRYDAHPNNPYRR